MKQLIVAGIGSRQAPEPYCTAATKIGQLLYDHDHRGRSGHADGLDWAFEQGLREKCDVFYPWASFNDKYPALGKKIIVGPSPERDELVRLTHPIYKKTPPGELKPGAFKLHRRNGAQILGLDLIEPCDAVVCWSKGSGGTEQALRLARGWNIPILNMYEEQWNTVDKVWAELERISAAK